MQRQERKNTVTKLQLKNNAQISLESLEGMVTTYWNVVQLLRCLNAGTRDLWSIGASFGSSTPSLSACAPDCSVCTRQCTITGIKLINTVDFLFNGHQIVLLGAPDSPALLVACWASSQPRSSRWKIPYRTVRWWAWIVWWILVKILEDEELSCLPTGLSCLPTGLSGVQWTVRRSDQTVRCYPVQHNFG
jgi:hypothetical protein